MKPKDIKEQILKDRGLMEHQPAKRKPRRLVSNIPIPPDVSKTTHMLLVEYVHRKPIQELLMGGSLTIVGKKLNLSPSTVSKWRKRLKLTYTPDNLPNCTHCSKHTPLCEVGYCSILHDLELWDLIPLKQEQILNG